MIQVIHRCFDILELIAQDRSRLYPLSEISGRLGLNKATCANIIKTMVARGYLEQEGRKAGYRLGSMAYLLTGNYSHRQELLSIATEQMSSMSSALDESCILSVIKDNARIVIHEIKSTHELQVVNRKEKEVYSTATGRMIVACLEEKEQREFVRKYGIPPKEVWNGVEDQDDLILELTKIKKKQLAIQISDEQIVGLAVPIFKDNRVIASLGVYLPQSRYTFNMQSKVQEEIQKAGNLINSRLNNNMNKL